MDAWPGLSKAERRRAARSASDALRALRTWHPSDALSSSLTWPSTAELTTPELVIGASIHPVPIERASLLIDELRMRDGIDRAMVDASRSAIERLGHLAPVADDPLIGGLIHGDLHLSNIWWSDCGQAELIDFEWVRFAAAWMELARLRENADADEAEGLDAHIEFMGWLEEDYPELFAVDQLGDRIRLLCLAFQVRQSLIWPPPASESDMVADHPLRMLQRLLHTSNPAW